MTFSPFNRPIGIIGSQDNYYVQDLQRAAMDMDVRTQVVNSQELSASILRTIVDDSKQVRGANLSLQLDMSPNLNALSIEVSPVFRGLLVRSMPLGSLEQVIFRMDCLHAWQAEGVPVINSPHCLETSIDKWLTLHRLHRAGVPVPLTIVCQNRQQALVAFEHLGEDVLVKPLFGGEGRGIVRLTDRDLAWRTFSTLHQLGHVLYLQQFIPNLGYDIRVLVIGKRMLSIRRYAPEDDYRTNISQGGRAEPHQLNELERDLAERSAAAVGGEMVGIDLLPARDGNVYVLEVNAVPGWRGLAKCLNMDVARLAIEHAASRTLETQAAFR